MIKKIEKPTSIEAAGTPSKLIEEFFGRVNSGDEHISIARMKSPSGWIEPAQTPEFDEYTLVLDGELHVKTNESDYIVKAGEVIMIPRNTWVQYSTPSEGGAEYIAICVPAFSTETVNRDE